MSRLDKYSNRGERGRTVKERGGVPFTTRLAVMFGGFLVQFGAAFFAFGMIAWWVFGVQSDVTSWAVFSGSLHNAQGQVTNVESTGISVGGSDSDPGTPIYRVFYEFNVDGLAYRDKSYGTGYSPAVGTPVKIEYLPGDPATSRIEGKRKRPVGAWGLFVVIFPGVGLMLMVPALLRNARIVRVLHGGVLTRGRLVSKEATSTKINNSTVYKFTFEFEDASGVPHRVTGKTHHTSLLEDEETERILYNPAKPDEGVLVDILPGRPKVDDAGRLQSVGVVAAATNMALPLGGLLAHGAIGLIVYIL